MVGQDPGAATSPSQGLLRLAGGTLILKIVGQGLLFVVMVVLARLLGDRAYGQYIYALAWTRIFVILVKSGYDTALLRFLPAYGVEGQWTLVRGILRTAVTVTLAAWLVLAVGTATAVTGLAGRLEAGLVPTLLVAIGVVLVQALTELGMAVLRSWNRPVHAVLPNFVLRPALVALAVVVGLFVLDLPRTSTLAMGAMGVASGSCLLLLGLWILRSKPVGLAATPGRSTSPDWSRTALTMLLVDGIQLVLMQTDTIMVGSMLDATHAGYYGTASRLAGLVLFGATAAYTVVAPRIAACHKAGDKDGLQAMLDMSVRGVLMFALPVAIVLVVGRSWILALWGEPFTAAGTALVILAVVHVVNAACGPTGYIMTMTGHERFAAKVLGGAAVLNIVLNALFIPRWGLVGASMATGLTFLLRNSFLVVYARRRLGLRTMVSWPRRTG